MEMQKTGLGLIDTSKDPITDVNSNRQKKQFTLVDNDPVIERLCKREKKNKVIRTADDALLSTLPTATLKYLKARRKVNSFEKVPLTYYRERQLRSIFRGLDFDGMGDIHLDLVKEAADYAEEKLKPKRGQPVFTNVRGMFEAMDEDGDGTVDFHEFTIAMTGSSSSTMDKATEHDVERLTARFLEFANIKKRERAVSVIHDNDGVDRHDDTAAPTMGEIKQLEAHMRPEAKAIMQEEAKPLVISQASYDVQKLDAFRTCFSVFNKNVSTEDLIAEAKEREELRLKSKKKKRASSKETAFDEIVNFTEEVTKTQEILDKYLHETRGFRFSSERHTGEEAEAKQQEFMKIQERAKQRRLKDAEDNQKDIDTTESRRRELAEKKYIASFDRVKKLSLSERARLRKPPSLLPVDNKPIRKGLRMQLQARREIEAAKEELALERRNSDLSSVRTGDSGGLARLR